MDNNSRISSGAEVNMKRFFSQLHVRFISFGYDCCMQLYVYTKRMMGTEIYISVVIENEAHAQNIADDAFRVLDYYEKKFSRFIPTSELSLLNTSKDEIVSEDFFKVLETSYSLYKKTQGAFNPLVQIERHGYGVDYTALKNTLQKENIDTYNIDFDSVLFDTDTQRVRLIGNQKLDFNGVLKGYLASKITQELMATYQDCQGLIVNIGGDLCTTGLDEHQESFEFYLHSPVTQKEQSVRIHNTCLVTSGTYKRTWRTLHGTKNHILDASGTRNPSSPIVSASVIHVDGALAEAFATMFIVNGYDQNSEEVIKQHGLTYWLVQSDGQIITNIV